MHDRLRPARKDSRRDRERRRRRRARTRCARRRKEQEYERGRAQKFLNESAGRLGLAVGAQRRHRAGLRTREGQSEQRTSIPLTLVRFPLGKRRGTKQQIVIERLHAGVSLGKATLSSESLITFLRLVRVLSRNAGDSLVSWPSIEEAFHDKYTIPRQLHQLQRAKEKDADTNGQDDVFLHHRAASGVFCVPANCWTRTVSWRDRSADRLVIADLSVSR